MGKFEQAMLASRCFGNGIHPLELILAGGSPLMQPEAEMVSAVIPTRNRPNLVSRATSSALNQTWGNLEVIVVVDGPDEETSQVLGQIDDPRLRVLKSASFCSCGQPENSHTAGILPIGDEFRERIIFRGIEEIIGKRPPQSVGDDEF